MPSLPQTKQRPAPGFVAGENPEPTSCRELCQHRHKYRVSVTKAAGRSRGSLLPCLALDPKSHMGRKEGEKTDAASKQGGEEAGEKKLTTNGPKFYLFCGTKPASSWHLFAIANTFPDMLSLNCCANLFVFHKARRARQQFSRFCGFSLYPPPHRVKTSKAILRLPT